MNYFSCYSDSIMHRSLNQQGYGKIDKIWIHPNCFISYEKGVWYNDSSPIQFSNVLRWNFDLKENQISLEHLRYGLVSPVFLILLTESGDNCLTSCQAHQCKKDQYHMTLTWNDQGIYLNWNIQGPKKKDLISYFYYS